MSISNEKYPQKFSIESLPLNLPYNLIKIDFDEPIAQNQDIVLIFNYKGENFRNNLLRITKEGVVFGLYSLWFPNKPFNILSDKPEIPNSVFKGSLTIPKDMYLFVDADPKIISENNVKTYTWEISQREVIDFEELIIGKYKKFVKKHGDFTYEAYLTDKYIKLAPELLEHFAYGIDFCSRKFGPFPWPRKEYKIILKPTDGGPEYINNRFIAFDRQNFLDNYLNAFQKDKFLEISGIYHEVSHIWWGRQVRPTLKTVFLIEGLAEYSGALACREKFGEKVEKDFYLEYLKRYKEFLADGKKEQSLDKVIPIFGIGLPYFYNKGAWICRMLEYIGGEKFINALQVFVKKYKFKFANYQDFQNVCEEVYGQKLDWFFDQWLRSTKKLDYAISDVKSIKEEDGYNTTFTVSNLGEISMPFEVYVEILTGTKKEKEIRKAKLPDKTQNISFKTKDEITSIIIDPNYWLLDIDRENNKWKKEDNIE